MQKPRLRIGIICTSLVEESIKDELLSCASRKRPWLADVITEHTIMEDGKRCTSDDYAVGYYIKWAYSNVDIEFINPHTMSLTQLHKNDLNVSLIFDVLEAFHIAPHVQYAKFVAILPKIKNLYPSLVYQTFINHKSVYYRFLKNRGIPIVPFFSVTKAQWKKNPGKIAQSVLQKANRQKWKCIIAKPDWGQEGICFQKFHPEVTKERLLAYTERIFKLYPGIVFQKYIPGFDNGNVKEFRTYFVGNKYKYTIITDAKSDIPQRPFEEGGKVKSPYFGRVKALANEVIKILPDIFVAGIKMDRLLTRIDIALLSTGDVFVNECEMVPSLYSNVPNKVVVDRELGDQLVRMTRKFVAARNCKKRNNAQKAQKTN